MEDWLEHSNKPHLDIIIVNHMQSNDILDSV